MEHKFRKSFILMKTKTEHSYPEEDEIDLKELFQTIYKYKFFILLFTLLITFITTIYVYQKTPIYQVKSNVQIGFIGKDLIDNSDEIVKKLTIIFNVEDKLQSKKQFSSEVSSITTNKKLKNFIEIKTEAISNDKALKKNQEVILYLQKLYVAKINQYIFNTKNNIKNIEEKINTIKIFEMKNIERKIKLLHAQSIAKIDEQIKILNEQEIKKLQRKIKLLKTQSIAKIDEQIKILNEQEIKKLQRKIKLLKTQSITKIDDKITFYTKTKIPTLMIKVTFHTNKLKEYSASVAKLYKKSKNSENPTLLTITSIQMVNYQNLILNSQNRIEDLKVEIEKIKNETIPNLQREKVNIQNITIKDLQLKIDNIKNIQIVNLQREKDNIKNIKIKDLQLKIDNIKNIQIVNLQREKENIENDTIRKLNYQFSVTLPNKIGKLQEQIQQLRFNMSAQNIQNSHLVGHFIIKDHPIKPKKKLIIIVAFITSLILAIFLIFLFEFIKNEK